MAEGREVKPPGLPNEAVDETRKLPKAPRRNSRRPGAASRSFFDVAARRHRAYLQPPPSSRPRRSQAVKEEVLLVQPLVTQLPEGRVPVAVLGQATNDEHTRLNVNIYNHGLGESEDVQKASRNVRAMVWLVSVFRVLSFIADHLESQPGREDTAKPRSAFELGSDGAILAFQLVVPAFGYCGASYRSRALTCTFACGSLCFSVASALSLFALLSLLKKGSCHSEQHVSKWDLCLVWAQGSDMIFERIVMVVGYAGDITFNALGFCFARTLFKLQRPKLPSRNGEEFPAKVPTVDAAVGGVWTEASVPYDDEADEAISEIRDA